MTVSRSRALADGRSPARLNVEVELFATLAHYLPPVGPAGRALVDLPAGATVADLLRGLGIPVEMSRIVLVNGHDAEDARPLEPGDVVSAFPPLAGGAPRGDGRLGRRIGIRRAEASRNPVGLPDFKSGVQL